MRAVILGSGAAGLTAAERLRQYDGAMKITLVSWESGPPYASPAMADYFRTRNEEVLFWKGRNVCKKLRLGRRSRVGVLSIRPDRHRVELNDRTCLPYDRLLIATGARLFVPVPGYHSGHVYNFNSLRPASRLVRHIRETTNPHVVIVGGGFNGVVAALLLSDLGGKVTMLEMTDRIMLRTLDEETSALVLATLQRRGVTVRLETRAVRFHGRMRVDSVELSSGERLRADVYVAATGVKPNVEFLEGSGINLDWGIRVDDRLRTNAPDVFAAGDVAEAIDGTTGRTHLRGGFSRAVVQGEVAAGNMFGLDTTYQDVKGSNRLNHMCPLARLLGESSTVALTENTLSFVLVRSIVRSLLELGHLTQKNKSRAL